MSLRSRIFAATYDRLESKVEKAGLARRRQLLLAGASGRVLEIGGGTGANLQHYGEGVESLTLTEPDPHMLKRLVRHAAEEGPHATVLRAPAEDLPFEDDSFDTVVSTLVLCGVTDQPRALRELRRVIRPGGKLLLIEHVRSDDPDLGRLQDRMNRLHRLFAGCNCNRRTLDSIEEAGFSVTEIEHTAMPKGPKLVRPLIVGAAESRS